MLTQNSVLYIKLFSSLSGVRLVYCMYVTVFKYSLCSFFTCISFKIHKYRVAQNKIPHRRICNISATSGQFFSEMFWIRIPIFIVSFLHLDQRLSPQGSDLPEPFPRSILAHSATVLSHNMALITTSIKSIYHCLYSSWLVVLCVSFTTVGPNVSCRLSCITNSFVFYRVCFIALLSLYFTYLCIYLYCTALMSCTFTLKSVRNNTDPINGKLHIVGGRLVPGLPVSRTNCQTT